MNDKNKKLMSARLTGEEVKHIAKLANLHITESEEKKLTSGFNDTLQVVDRLFQLDVSDKEPTHQVTGLFNVFREDKVDEKKMLSQSEALSNSKRNQNGYFVVDQILESE